MLIRQKVIYEWKSIKCTHCKMFGYEDISCKKKKRCEDRVDTCTKRNSRGNQWSVGRAVN